MRRCADYHGEDAAETELGRALIAEARSFVEGFDWCADVRECYASYIVVGDVVAVVLLRIHSQRPDVDEWLWVVVGDLPPAYLVTDEALDAASALRAYIREMDTWVTAVRSGGRVDELMPVTTREGGLPLDPTEEVADDLERRLLMLRRWFLDTRERPGA